MAGEQRLLLIWGVVLAESAAAFEVPSISCCILLWLMGQASGALLLDWRRRGGASAPAAPLVIEWLMMHAATAAVLMLGGLTLPLRILAGAGAFGSLAFALFAPAELAAWRRAPYWVGAALGACAAAAGYAVIILVQAQWNGGIGAATLGAVAFVLRCFDPSAVVAGLRLHAFGFAVTIEPGCSGFEGMVLIALFTAGWLVWFRREYRFPQTLVLIPVGVVLSWCLNVVRLVALMWIGSVAGRATALGGFHSQAGWILFTALAIALCAVSSRVQVFRKTVAASEVREESGHLPAAAWLVPFIAIQTAAMLSAAARSDFEWLYPLRTIAGAAAIWWFRKEIPLPQFGRVSVAAGALIAAVWASATFAYPAVSGPFDKLAALGEPWHAAWIVMRILGAAAVVPVAEELAFRGILQPRFGWIASSASFGLLHGSRWLPGILAGLVLGWLSRRGGLSVSIAAHATANLLLLALVWISGDWRFW